MVISVKSHLTTSNVAYVAERCDWKMWRVKIKADVAIELTMTWCSSPSPTLVVNTTTIARCHSSTLPSHSLISGSTPQQFQPTLAAPSSPLAPLSSPSSPTQPRAPRHRLADRKGVGWWMMAATSLVTSRVCKTTSLQREKRWAKSSRCEMR